MAKNIISNIEDGAYPALRLNQVGVGLSMMILRVVSVPNAAGFIFTLPQIVQGILQLSVILARLTLDVKEENLEPWNTLGATVSCVGM